MVPSRLLTSMRVRAAVVLAAVLAVALTTEALGRAPDPLRVARRAFHIAERADKAARRALADVGTVRIIDGSAGRPT